MKRKEQGVGCGEDEFEVQKSQIKDGEMGTIRFDTGCDKGNP